MDANDFLNRFFMMTALGKWAEYVDKYALTFDDVKDLVYVDMDCSYQELPEAGRQAYTRALLDEQSPKVSYLEDGVGEAWGWFVTHDDDELRRVCWAEMGEKAFAKHAARWWQTVNPAVPDPPPEDAPKPKPPEEKELAPWSRELSVKIVTAMAEGMGDMDQDVRNKFEVLVAGLDDMSDWDLWTWLDQIHLWHFYGSVSSVVVAACWPRPFYKAPERPTPVPDAQLWAYTWSARPHTTSVRSDTPMDEAAALEEIHKVQGRIPVGIALWPCDEDGIAL